MNTCVSSDMNRKKLLGREGQERSKIPVSPSNTARAVAISGILQVHFRSAFVRACAIPERNASTRNAVSGILQHTMHSVMPFQHQTANGGQLLHQLITHGMPIPCVAMDRSRQANRGIVLGTVLWSPSQLVSKLWQHALCQFCNTPTLHGSLLEIEAPAGVHSDHCG